MDTEGPAARRVRFYSAHDLAAGFHVDRVVELLDQFDPTQVPATVVDAIELSQVQAYLENRMLPRSYTDEQVETAVARVPQLRGAIGRFFSTIDDSNVEAVVTGVDYEYQSALVELLGRNKAFDRCSASTMLPALAATGVHLSTLLGNKKLVHAYDNAVRDELMAAPENAEHVVSKFLQDEVRHDIHLPPSLTPADCRALMDSYLDSPDPNLNHVGLIESAPVSNVSGVDPKLKLKAKRRRAQITEEFFKNNTGTRTGAEVRISDTQDEAVEVTLDGMVSQITLSRRWLDETTDFPSILNNFHHLVGIADSEGILTLPAHASEFGVMERTLGLKGKSEYRTSAAFRANDMNTLLQIKLLHGWYQHTNGIDIEKVIAWFFRDYLPEEFGAKNFSFTPCDSSSSYLQKVRHLFSEMESVVNQFTLYVQDGELDRELLGMTSEQVRYKEIPTLLDGKYLYATDNEQIASILFLLFSDQSMLNYINEELKDDNAARLLLLNNLAYTDFEDYQRNGLDHLISLGVLKDTGTRLVFANNEQLRILISLNAKEAASYYHLSETGRGEADAMVAKGWLSRGSSLMTEAEGKYFNYLLNNVDFSNGPQLRNKYTHGSQPHADDSEDAHATAYFIAMRLILALIIKLNDDLCLAADELETSPEQD
jgi:hypothetical protein